MKCEGFRPGCTNEAVHKERGYWLCLPCVRSFAEYTPILTTTQALAAYASAYRAWCRGQTDGADLLAAEKRALAAGANVADLNAAIAPQPRRSPAP